MGVDYVGLQAISLALQWCEKFHIALTLGRQNLNVNYSAVKNSFNQLGLVTPAGDIMQPYCESLLRHLGFDNVVSLDANSYENATIIHDMNKPIISDMKYDFIFDGGTIEHIFNIPQVCQNIIDILEIGGILCSCTTNNNYSGHGFYQFSPELFLKTFSEPYGMKIINMFLAEVDSPHRQWIPIQPLHEFSSLRNESRFFGSTSVYIITIAKKISDGKRLLANCPQQYSYENRDWKTKKTFL